jgi:hypothetical protein
MVMMEKISVCARLAAVVCFLCLVGCSEAVGDEAPYLGRWLAVEGSIDHDCAGGKNSLPLPGYEFDISSRAQGKLASVFNACRLALKVEPDRAVLDGSQECTISLNWTDAEGRFTSYELVPAGDTLLLTGTARAHLTVKEVEYDCNNIGFTGGVLVRADEPASGAGGATTGTQ